MPVSPAPQYPFPPRRRGDNRSDATRFFDDVRDLARMASIALRYHQEIHVMADVLPKHELNTNKLYRAKYLREFQFLLMDIEERAEFLDARCDAIEEMLPAE